MRSLYVFIGGLAAGLVIQMAVAQNSDSGIVELNHIGIGVPDLDEAVRYYEETFGFPEAFRVRNAEGQTLLVYMQVSESTFVELQSAADNRPMGINHFGLHVSDMDRVRDRFIAQGAEVGEIRSGSTNAILSNVIDLNGHRIELSEYPPDSLQGKFLGL